MRKKRRLVGFGSVLALILLINPVAIVLPHLSSAVLLAESGGPLSEEQSSFDVTFYDLSLTVDPVERSIKGHLTVQARIIKPMEWLALDLDTSLKVESVVERKGTIEPVPLIFEHHDGQLRIALSDIRAAGDSLTVTVYYGGRPRIAPRPPWWGGFTWSTTADGQPWITVSCQYNGADIWWPCKDHPSDEPDSMALHITVPENLVCAANGRLRGITRNSDATVTYHWFSSNPINNYCVTLNIAPYRTIEADYTSVTGEIIPVTFWVLPENYSQGLDLFPRILEHLHFMETYFGPYPFRGDKYGVAEAPYLGMEHQTIIAYGNQYRTNSYGFDDLHLHELSHEWWGNLVTCVDWSDMWLHEGFAVYTEALYAEYLHGEQVLYSYMTTVRSRVHNLRAVAPRETQTTTQIYFMPPDYTVSNGDIYNKGACILHTLRYLIGDDAFFQALRLMAYPDPALEAVTDGDQCRLASSDDFQHIVESVTGADLEWFFDLYLRQEQLPLLVTEIRRSRLRLSWETPGNRPFPMPVPVQIGEEVLRVEIPRRGTTIDIPGGILPKIDEQEWILKEE